MPLFHRIGHQPMREQQMAESAPNGNAKFLISGAVLIGLVWGAGGLGAAFCASPSSAPDLASPCSIRWHASGSGFGTDFVQPPSGPRPVPNDPARPSIP